MQLHHSKNVMLFRYHVPFFFQAWLLALVFAIQVTLQSMLQSVTDKVQFNSGSSEGKFSHEQYSGQYSSVSILLGTLHC